MVFDHSKANKDIISYKIQPFSQRFQQIYLNVQHHFAPQSQYSMYCIHINITNMKRKEFPLHVPMRYSISQSRQGSKHLRRLWDTYIQLMHLQYKFCTWGTSWQRDKEREERFEEPGNQDKSLLWDRVFYVWKGNWKSRQYSWLNKIWTMTTPTNMATWSEEIS